MEDFQAVVGAEQRACAVFQGEFEAQSFGEFAGFLQFAKQRGTRPICMQARQAEPDATSHRGTPRDAQSRSGPPLVGRRVRGRGRWLSGLRGAASGKRHAPQEQSPH